MTTPDKLHEAFEAWHRCVDQHVEMMRAVSAGAALDAATMTQKMGEIDVLHGTWMDMVLRRDEAGR